MKNIGRETLRAFGEMTRAGLALDDTAIICMQCGKLGKSRHHGGKTASGDSRLLDS